MRYSKYIEISNYLRRQVDKEVNKEINEDEDCSPDFDVLDFCLLESALLEALAETYTLPENEIEVEEVDNKPQKPSLTIIKPFKSNSDDPTTPKAS